MNKHLMCKYMQEICKNITMQQICTDMHKYARNMQEICTDMHKYAKIRKEYTRIMQEGNTA